MDDPIVDIPSVVYQLTATNSPDIQKAAIERYFTPDAGFNHFLCRVARAPRSREVILGIYQWYRELSPTLKSQVDWHVYDRERNQVYVNITQTFHLWFSPFKGVPAHLLVRLTLNEVDGKHYIIQQEDFYQPEEIAAIVLPPLAFIVNLAKLAGAWASNIGAAIHQRLGLWWTPGKKPIRSRQ